MKIKKNDNVIVITGKENGKEGKVLAVDPINMKVTVEGINKVKKHVKPTTNEPGGIIQVERPIDLSNVMLIDPNSKKPTRVGFKVEGGKKVRIAKVSGKEV